MTQSIVAVNSAELVTATDLPDLGEFYIAGTGKRVPGFKVAATDYLNQDSIVARTTNVSSMRYYEVSTQNYKKFQSGLNISAQAELFLMNNKIHLQASFDWTKRDESQDNVIRISKIFRVVTHRRTINMEDARVKLGEGVQTAATNAIKVFGATHFASEVTYGHYVTMTVAFDANSALANSDMTASGEGDINFDSFSGKLTGSVHIVNNSDQGSKAFNVSLTSSDPNANIAFTSDLDGTQIYAQATATFNAIVQRIVSQIQSGAATAENAVALGFVYTPLSMIQNPANLLQQVKTQLRTDALAAYASIKDGINRFNILCANPDMRYVPRFQKEIQFDLQELRKTRAAMQAALQVATDQQIATGSYDGFQTVIDLMTTPPMTTPPTTSATTILFNWNPAQDTNIFQRFRATQRRVLELQQANIQIVNSVADLQRICATSQATPTRAASAASWDGAGVIKRYEIAQGSAATSPWQPVDRTPTYAFEGSASLSECCIAINQVVQTASTHSESPCIVLDALSFQTYDNYVDSSPHSSWYVRGLKSNVTPPAQDKQAFVRGFHVGSTKVESDRAALTLQDQTGQVTSAVTNVFVEAFWTTNPQQALQSIGIADVTLPATWAANPSLNIDVLEPANPSLVDGSGTKYLTRASSFDPTQRLNGVRIADLSIWPTQVPPPRGYTTLQLTDKIRLCYRTVAVPVPTVPLPYLESGMYHVCPTTGATGERLVMEVADRNLISTDSAIVALEPYPIIEIAPAAPTDSSSTAPDLSGIRIAVSQTDPTNPQLVAVPADSLPSKLQQQWYVMPDVDGKCRLASRAVPTLFLTLTATPPFIGLASAPTHFDLNAIVNRGLLRPDNTKLTVQVVPAGGSSPVTYTLAFTDQGTKLTVTYVGGLAPEFTDVSQINPVVGGVTRMWNVSRCGYDRYTLSTRGRCGATLFATARPLLGSDITAVVLAPASDGPEQKFRISWVSDTTTNPKLSTGRFSMRACATEAQLSAYFVRPDSSIAGAKDLDLPVGLADNSELVVGGADLAFDFILL